MNNRPLRFIVIFLSFILCFCLLPKARGQNRFSDSLSKKILSDREDTIKFRDLQRLAMNYLILGKFNDASGPIRELLDLSERINNKNWMSEAYRLKGYTWFAKGDYDAAIGEYLTGLKLAKESKEQKSGPWICIDLYMIYKDQGNLPEALRYSSEGLKWAEFIQDVEAIAECYNGLGLTAEAMGNLPDALKYQLKCLKIREAQKQKRSIADCNNNIGNVYWRMGKYPEALKYQFLALKTREEMDDKIGIADSYNNIGNIYFNEGNFQEAMKSHLYTLDLQQALGRNRSIADAYNNLGLDYESLKNYEEALNCHFSAKVIRRQIGDLEGLAGSCINLSSIYIKIHKFKEAENNLDSAEKISLKIGDKNWLVDTYLSFTQLDSATGNFRKAFSHYKRYSLYHDSIYNEDNSKKTVAAEMNYEFEKKQAVSRAEQERITAIAASESKKQKIILYSVCLLLLIILAFVLFAYRNYRLKLKANNTLEVQKKSIEDSIRYAQRIQEAILPPVLFEKGEVHDHFLIFQPKEVVSGDFYWRYREGDYVFIAIVDCTGHGVPGAMMSMLGYDLLENAVKDKGLREPSSILNLINKKVIEKLDAYNSESAIEGMDLSLCRFNLVTRELVYAGAKNDLFLLSENELSVLKVTKCSLGYALEMEYTQESRILKPKDMLYLMTDGFAYQKGGPGGSKFTLKKVKSIFQTLSALSCSEQKQRLLDELEQWKGVIPQKDDILLVGFII